MARADFGPRHPSFGLPVDVEVELAGLRGDLFSMERAGWRIHTDYDPSMMATRLSMRIGDIAYQQVLGDHLSDSMRGLRKIPIRIPPDQIFGPVRRSPSPSQRETNLKADVERLEGELTKQRERAEAAEKRLADATPSTVAEHLAAALELQRAARPKSRRRAEKVSDEEVRAGHLRVA